jgi:APA family basic amino acid/polyamine antiporter
MQQPALKRSLSFTLLVLYGLGTTIGAGIYVLVGKVAGAAGVYAPLAFILAALVAIPTALSFGELAARYPASAGEAIYVEEAFGRPRLAALVGLAVVFVGLVSSAAISAGAVGYLRDMVALPAWLGILLVVGVLCLVAIWGISESVIITAAATVIEVGGLLLVVWSGRHGLDVARLADAVAAAPPFSEVGAAGVISGAVLAFYAFIGFEDMVNISEEVHEPSHNMPRAIMLTMGITMILYVLVSLVSVTAMPIDELAASTAPITKIFERGIGLSAVAFDVLIIVAVANGALVQIIMASRVLYGLARQGWLPAAFGTIAARTRTPVFATVAAAAAVFAMAALFPLELLARVTSMITLMIFALVNLSLLRVRTRESPSMTLPRLPAVVPVLGFFLSLGLGGFQLSDFLRGVVG